MQKIILVLVLGLSTLAQAQEFVPYNQIFGFEIDWSEAAAYSKKYKEPQYEVVTMTCDDSYYKAIDVKFDVSEFDGEEVKITKVGDCDILGNFIDYETGYARFSGPTSSDACTINFEKFEHKKKTTEFVLEIHDAC